METMSQAGGQLMAQWGPLLLAFALDALGAILLLIGGWVLANWVKRNLARTMARTGRIDATLRPILAEIVRYLILVVVVVAVLGQFGVQTASILAVLGAAGLAIGLALQGTLSNVAAGMMLLLLRPFHVGDYVDAEGIAGTIEEIGLFTTQMRTYDGIYLFVPNGSIWNRPIKNFTRNPTRLMDVRIGISYDDDIDTGTAVLRDLMTSDPRILKEPEPQVMVMQLGESAVELNMRCWTKTADYWPLLWDLTRLAKQRIEEAGLTVPFPQRVVHVDAAQRDAEQLGTAY